MILARRFWYSSSLADGGRAMKGISRNQQAVMVRAVCRDLSARIASGASGLKSMSRCRKWVCRDWAKERVVARESSSLDVRIKMSDGFIAGAPVARDGSVRRKRVQYRRAHRL